MKQPYPIRAAVAADAVALSHMVTGLAHCLLGTEPTDLPSWLSASLTPEAFAERLEHPEFQSWLIEIDAKVVAYISMQTDGHLYHLFVAEAFQGRGLARQLWQHQCQQLPLEQYTLRSSLNAVPVYKAFGFVETGPRAERGGQWYQPMQYRPPNRPDDPN